VAVRGDGVVAQLMSDSNGNGDYQLLYGTPRPSIFSRNPRFLAAGELSMPPAHWVSSPLGKSRWSAATKLVLGGEWLL
jgi:hypothetical protein